MNRAYLIPILAIALHCGHAGAEERLRLDKTTILGNRELPKVTYVVPWRDVPSDIPAWQPSPVARPYATPLDGELFQRQVNYLKQLNKLDEGNQAQ